MPTKQAYTRTSPYGERVGLGVLRKPNGFPMGKAERCCRKKEFFFCRGVAHCNPKDRALIL
jgi:hypothetical protein